MILRNTLSASILARDILETRTESSRTPLFPTTDIIPEETMPDTTTILITEKPLPMEVIEKDIVGSIFAFFAVLGISSFLLVLGIAVLYFVMFILEFSVI